jgi:hypothetical protein
LYRHKWMFWAFNDTFNNYLFAFGKTTVPGKETTGRKSPTNLMIYMLYRVHFAMDVNQTRNLQRYSLVPVQILLINQQNIHWHTLFTLLFLIIQNITLSLQKSFAIMYIIRLVGDLRPVVSFPGTVVFPNANR